MEEREDEDVGKENKKFEVWVDEERWDENWELGKSENDVSEERLEDKVDELRKGDEIGDWRREGDEEDERRLRIWLQSAEEVRGTTS